MLILYGDHLPSLGLEGSGMKSGSLYRTRYLIWDNFGLPRREEDLAAYQLSASALGRIGVTNGTMNAFHQFCREESTYRSDLRLIQYDQLYGGRYLAGTGAVYPPTELRHGGFAHHAGRSEPGRAGPGCCLGRISPLIARSPGETGF